MGYIYLHDLSNLSIVQTSGADDDAEGNTLEIKGLNLPQFWDIIFILAESII
jgi:hypothetical protein